MKGWSLLPSKYKILDIAIFRGKSEAEKLTCFVFELGPDKCRRLTKVVTGLPVWSSEHVGTRYGYFSHSEAAPTLRQSSPIDRLPSQLFRPCIDQFKKTRQNLVIYRSFTSINLVSFFDNVTTSQRHFSFSFLRDRWFDWFYFCKKLIFSQTTTTAFSLAVSCL